MDKKKEAFDEKRILEECKGNLNAFSALYKEFVNEVYRYTYSVVQSKEKAEDITSKTFMTGLEKVREFEWRGISYKFYLLKIARNLIYDQQKETKEKPIEDKEMVKDVENLIPSDVAVEDELKETLKKLIMKLSDNVREVLVLRIWEEFKFKEIAEMLNISEGAAKVRFSRGVKKLKELADEEKEKSKKLRSVNFITIITGFKLIGNAKTFLPTEDFVSELGFLISNKVKLLINNKPMENTQNKQQEGPTTKPAESAAKEVTVGSKVIQGVVAATVTVVALVAGAAIGYFYNESQKVDKSAGANVATQNKADSSTDTTTTTTTAETTTTETAKKDPYEGWKTGNFKDCNISFKYPSNWYTDKYENGEENCTRLSTLKTIPATEVSNISILISVDKYANESMTPDLQDPESYYEDLKKYPSQSIKISSKEVDGEKRLYVIHTNEYDTTYYKIYYEVDGKYYRFYWAGKDIDKYQDTVDEIIDTIKIG